MSKAVIWSKDEMSMCLTEKQKFYNLNRTQTVALKQIYNNNYKKSKRVMSGRLEFTINFEQFVKMSQENCYYCNGKVEDVGNTINYSYETVKYNGIDRINNTKGYVPGNCRPCCKSCNMFKGVGTVKQMAENAFNIFNLPPPLRYLSFNTSKHLCKN